MSSESTATNDSNNDSESENYSVTDSEIDAQLDGANECIRVLPPDSNTRTTVLLADIRTLAFTGKDAASGKSFENWIRRYAAKKIAGEVASIESEVL